MRLAGGRKAMGWLGWLAGIVLLGAMLGGCASTPKSYGSGFYDAPARAYTLDLDSPAFRDSVTLSEQCDAGGGTLNIWDVDSRFFRIDYLKINKSPLAQVPAFASERDIADLVLAGYVDRVFPQSKGINRSAMLVKSFITTKKGNALFSVMSLSLNDSVLPKGVLDNSYYYAFLVFQKGDFAYIVQHRSDTYQPDRLKDLLVSVATNMKIPGNSRDELVVDSTDSYWQGTILGYFLKNHVFSKTSNNDAAAARCN